MQEEVIISGFGGQGSLFAGQLLAYAAMDQDLLFFNGRKAFQEDR